MKQNDVEKSVFGDNRITPTRLTNGGCRPLRWPIVTDSRASIRLRSRVVGNRTQIYLLTFWITGSLHEFHSTEL